MGVSQQNHCTFRINTVDSRIRSHLKGGPHLTVLREFGTVRFGAGRIYSPDRCKTEHLPDFQNSRNVLVADALRLGRPKSQGGPKVKLSAFLSYRRSILKHIALFGDLRL
jgi:hypothetical protein